MKILVVVGMLGGMITLACICDYKYNNLDARTKVMEARFQKQDEDEEHMKEVRRQAFIAFGESMLKSSEWMIEDYERLKKRVDQDQKDAIDRAIEANKEILEKK